MALLFAHLIGGVRLGVHPRAGPVVAHGQAVDRISARLQTSDLVELNRRVEIDGVKPVRAAADWLRARGLA